MADIFPGSIDRRSLIKTSLAAVGAVVTIGGGPGSVLAEQGEPVARWAMLSDTHIPADIQDNYRGFYPYRNLREIAEQITSASPEAAVITGDLARLDGQPGDYVSLRKLITPIADKAPVFMALGNHDDRRNFTKVFAEHPGQKQQVRGKHVVVAETGPARLIVLDSLLYVNKVTGLLGKAQRQWLENYLEQCDDRPTLLCFHHSIGDGDGDLLDLPRVLDFVKSIRKVKAILYGHSHVYQYSRFRGIHLINLPATGYNFSDAQPVGWVDAQLTARGGKFTLRALAGSRDRDRSAERLTWRQ